MAVKETSTTNVLRIIFTLEGGGTITWNLQEPSNELTRTQVDTWAQGVITNQVIEKNAENATALKEAYLYSTTKTDLE